MYITIIQGLHQRHERKQHYPLGRGGARASNSRSAFVGTASSTDSTPIGSPHPSMSFDSCKQSNSTRVPTRLKCVRIQARGKCTEVVHTVTATFLRHPSYLSIHLDALHRLVGCMACKEEIIPRVHHPAWVEARLSARLSTIEQFDRKQ
jgi:hypothetical protein